jgi:hypothetical protein
MERQVRGIAGGISLAGGLGGLLLWRPLSAIPVGIGLGLVASALTNTCTMAKLLGKLPYNSGATCDLNQVIREIGAPRHDAPDVFTTRTGSATSDA